MVGVFENIIGSFYYIDDVNINMAIAYLGATICICIAITSIFKFLTNLFNK